MKKILLSLSTLLFVLFFGACQKFDLNDFSPCRMQTVSISAGIKADAPSTKTSVDEQITEGGKTFRKLVWSEKDRIGVIAQYKSGEFLGSPQGKVVSKIENAYVFPFDLSSGKGSENGVFEGDLPSGASIYKAYYPYNENGSGQITTEQQATKDNFDPSVALMEAERNDEGNLVFAHKAAYIRVQTDKEYNKIFISLNTKTTSSLSYSISNTPDIESGIYYIVVPAGNYEGLSFGAEIKGVTYNKHSDKSVELKDGLLLNLGLLKFSEIRIGDHTYVDLGLPSGTLWATCNLGATSL